MKWGLFRNKRLPLLYQEHDPELVLAFSFQFDWPGGFIYWEFIELLIPKVARCQPFRSMLCTLDGDFILYMDNLTSHTESSFRELHLEADVFGSSVFRTIKFLL